MLPKVNLETIYVKIQHRGKQLVIVIDISNGSRLYEQRIWTDKIIHFFIIFDRILADALADDANIYPSDIFPLSSARFFFRPAPRGGRYRRSFPVGRFTFGDFISQDASDRAFAFPRFASVVDDIPHLHPKAVPRPRFGRLQNDQSDASFQSKSA